MPSLVELFAVFFDRLFSDAHQKWIEHSINRLSAISFLLNLFLIFLCRTLPHPGPVLDAIGRNYLSAIYTPFSFILFNEALMLIAALPKSTTRALAKQFKIVSLIFIRKFFKDIAELDDVGKLARLSSEVAPVFLDVAAGLLMFFLVTVFLHAAQSGPVRANPSPEYSRELARFIDRKKVIALGLTAALVSLAFYNLLAFFFEAYRYVFLSSGLKPDPNTYFFTDLFAVMIFTDVLIVMLSLVLSDSYELVFRNEAFVIATILLRFSLTIERPYSAVLALSGMAFGIVTLLIYNYHSRIRVT